MFLLFAFLISISPKQLLHTLFAEHADISANLTKSEVQCNADAYNCDCNQTECTSPFLAAEFLTLAASSDTFTRYDDLAISSSLSPASIQLLLRGPPALI